MNDVENLAQAMKRASAELELPSPDWNLTTSRAHGLALRRLQSALAIGTIGGVLLLGGGLAARDAISGDDGGGTSQSTRPVHSEKHSEGGAEERGEAGTGQPEASGDEEQGTAPSVSEQGGKRNGEVGSTDDSGTTGAPPVIGEEDGSTDYGGTTGEPPVTDESKEPR